MDQLQLLEEIGHFVALLCEYCAIPIVLWIFSYLPKLKKEKNFKIYTFGFEFILIESCTFFSVFLRVFPERNEGLNNVVLAISAIFTFFLAIYFYVGNTLVSDEEDVGLQSFKITFYVFFVSWWVRLGILCVYSGLLGDYEMVVAAAFIYISLLLLCFRFFVKFLYTVFISPSVVSTKISNLVKEGRYREAISILKILIRASKGREENDKIAIYIQSVEDYANICYLRAHPKYAVKGLEKIDEILTSPFYSERNIFTCYILKIGLLIRLNKKEDAKAIVNTCKLFKDGKKDGILKAIDEDNYNVILPSF